MNNNFYKKADTDKILRLWEIDFIRGFAIISMILFHILFDLNYFNIANINTNIGLIRIYGYFTASLFVFIAGVSVFLSSERAKFSLSKEKYLLKYFKRGLFLLSLGLLITTATWIFIGSGTIVFGILHLLGISIIISPFFIRFKKYNFFIGIFVITIGFFFSQLTGPFYLIPLGITPEWFYSLDYEPLFPWFGVFLLGIAIGAKFYPGGKRQFEKTGFIKEESRKKQDGFYFLSEGLEYCGKHSLLIYLIHQPVIILILSLISGKILL